MLPWGGSNILPNFNSIEPLMQWADIDFHPPKRTLRQFAFLWILIIGGFAVWKVMVRGDSWTCLLLVTLAFVVGPVGIAKPQAVRPLYITLMVIAFPLGWTMSKIVLGLLFFGIFTPLGLFFRLKARDPLHLRSAVGKETCWTNKPMPKDVRQYFNQS